MLYPGCKALIIGHPIEENNNIEVELVAYYAPKAYVLRTEDEDYVYEQYNTEPAWEVDKQLKAKDADGSPITIPVVAQRYLLPLRCG